MIHVNIVLPTGKRIVILQICDRIVISAENQNMAETKKRFLWRAMFI